MAAQKFPDREKLALAAETREAAKRRRIEQGNEVAVSPP